jgi:hypothetical protein
MYNSSDEDLVYLMGGSRSDIDVCNYPKLNRRMYRKNGKKLLLTWTRSIVFRVACLIALTCLPGCSSLPDNSIPGPIGTVTIAAGLPAVTRNNKPYILAEQSKIYIGDIISTDERSTTGLALVSGHTIDIPPQTQWLVIDVTTNGVDYKSSSSLA